MTRNAISLTNRATPPGDAGSLWTMPATDVRAMTGGLGRLGHDAGSLLHAVGLGDADLDDPDRRVPCEVFGKILAAAQQRRFTPNLPLELARVTPIGAYPLLDYLVLTSDTVGDGVRQLACHRRLVGDPTPIAIDDRIDPIRVDLADSTSAFSVEYTVSLMVLHFLAETDGRFGAEGISFRHVPDDAAGFEQILGCPIRTAAAWNGLSISGAAWRLPLRRRDPVLRRVLETQAATVLARVPARTGVALEVQRVLMSQVVGGDTTVAAVARALAMSGRTLQRRLTAEGVSYQSLLDEARKESAGQHLSQPTLAIGEIAYLLGYSEPAPFHRAFKRWYGTTPDLFRRRQRGARSTAAVQHSPEGSSTDAVRRRNG